VRSWRISAGVQGVPEFLVDFDMLEILLLGGFRLSQA